jgi:ectoine hydroxylase-related dioxygenase (phytanoyl-CoA dioxygenase family)
MNVDQMDATLAERGWVTFDMPDPSGIFEARDGLLERLRKTLPELECLDNYHLHVTDDERHVEILYDLANFFWEAAMYRPIVTRNLALFRMLIGPDLLVQPCPYLRAVRPGLVGDAAPLHRDTYYGASPFEVSLVIPFTEMETSAAVRVISGSHVAPDSAYPFTQTVSPDVQVRSPKHQLGYAYAPRILDSSLMDIAEPVPVKVGQVLLFPLQLVHGGGSNSSRRTRFSTDIRLANSLAPVERSRGVRKDYFVPLCTSAITRSAQTVLAVNAAETAATPQ